MTPPETLAAFEEIARKFSATMALPTTTLAETLLALLAFSAWVILGALALILGALALALVGVMGYHLLVRVVDVCRNG